MEDVHCLELTCARLLSVAGCKLRLCQANHRSGYWSNLLCDWPGTAGAYSEQETKPPLYNISEADNSDYRWYWSFSIAHKRLLIATNHLYFSPAKLNSEQRNY